MQLQPRTSPCGRLYHDITGGGGIRENDDDPKERTHWQQRTDLFPQNRSKEYEKYPLVTADMLRNRRERPRRVKMLMRDFIEGTKSSRPPVEQQSR